MMTGTFSTVMNTLLDKAYMTSTSVTIAMNSNIEAVQEVSQTPTAKTSAYVSYKRVVDNVYQSFRIGGQ